MVDEVGRELAESSESVLGTSKDRHRDKDKGRDGVEDSEE